MRTHDAIGATCILVCHGFDDGVPTIIGLPLKSTIRHRPLSKLDTVMVLPALLTDYTSDVPTVDGSCLVVSRSVTCYAPVGLLRHLPPKEKSFILIENRPLSGYARGCRPCDLDV